MTFEEICERDGEDGLSNTFSFKNCAGQPLLQILKKTLEEIIPKLGNFLLCAEKA